MTRLCRLLLIASLPLLIAASPTPPTPAYGTYGFDTAGMDRTVAPGDDFFAYANGNWVRTNEIPADRGSLTTFSLLRGLADQRTAALIDETTRAPSAAGSDARKVGDFYASFMDQEAIEKRGLSPLRPAFDAIARVHTRRSLSRELGAQMRADVDVLNATNLYTERLFGLWVVEDLNDTSRYAPYLLQGGLGMPSREYYLSDSPRFNEVRAAYLNHVTAVLTLVGFDQAQARARRILALETEIARVHWTASDTTDVTKTNTRWTVEDFNRNAPGIDWRVFFAAAGLKGQAQIGAWQPSAIAGIAKLAGEAPMQTWRDYLAFHALIRAAPVLPEAFGKQDFAFNGAALNGTPEPSARWKRGVAATNAALGEAVGRMYVERYFTPDSKAQAQAMVANILAAFDRRIDRLDWMSPETKAKAHEKLANFQVGVGYPDRWRDYSGLTVRRGDAYGNWFRAELFEYHRNLAKLGRPVDRGEWYMTPQEVNALNAPLQNAIIFPAAILQPPFFDPHADAALNYGAIGGVIGHEISHGFDDTGALFDAHGALRNWWTPADMEHFKASGAALIAQYDAYKPFADLGVNGEQTLGENIADLAGLAVAYDGYHLSLKGAPPPVIDGTTADQRIFLGWAQNYRTKTREGAARRALITDVHSPGEYRADTVRNLDAWYEAFSVKPGQRLYLPPEKRVRVW